MKLSDIKGADVFDVIADCIVPITNIAADEKAMALFKKQVVPKAPMFAPLQLSASQRAFRRSCATTRTTWWRFSQPST